MEFHQQPIPYSVGGSAYELSPDILGWEWHTKGSALCLSIIISQQQPASSLSPEQSFDISSFAFSPHQQTWNILLILVAWRPAPPFSVLSFQNIRIIMERDGERTICLYLLFVYSSDGSAGNQLKKEQVKHEEQNKKKTNDQNGRLLTFPDLLGSRCLHVSLYSLLTSVLPQSRIPIVIAVQSL